MAPMTLTLDSRMRPIGLIRERTAARHLACALSEGRSPSCELVLADRTRRYRTPRIDVPAPIIVRWPAFQELTLAERSRVTRRVLLARDQWTCQYCGFVAHGSHDRARLTVDHVKPAHLFDSRAAATTWENVTTACRACNSEKAGMLPFECGMYPARAPREPHFVQIRFAGRLNGAQRDYVRSFYQLGDDDDLPL